MRKSISLALLSLTVAFSGQASGQALEEIVVTAQKREQGANDIGITMNAFTGEMLQDFGFSTAEDMAMLTPGLTVTSGGRPESTHSRTTTID